MLHLRFFAAIREKTGRAALEIEAVPGLTDIASLVQHLDQAVMPGCAAVLLADNTLVAVNRSVVSLTGRVADGDEIAFYPPVTGG